MLVRVAVLMLRDSEGVKRFFSCAVLFPDELELRKHHLKVNHVDFLQHTSRFKEVRRNQKMISVCSPLFHFVCPDAGHLP